MGLRNVTTSELAKKYRMSTIQATRHLTAVGIKPKEKTDTSRGTKFMWPNRAANAALRTFREEHPPKRTQALIAAQAKTKARSKTIHNVKSFHTAREAKTLTDLQSDIKALTASVVSLRAQLDVVLPGVNTIVRELTGPVAVKV